jgi:hypothetical protein
MAYKVETIFPVKVIDFGEVENASFLLEKTTLQITFPEPQVTLIKKGGYIVLDFGKEYHGGVRIITREANCFARLRVGESVGEACAELGEKSACNDHSPRDAKIFLSTLSDCVHFSSGFRFVRIDALDGDIKLKSVTLSSVCVDKERIGSFTCSDEKMNEIFETAVRTVTMCVQNDMIWDGIKRDRLVWIGDLYPELIAMTSLYSDCHEIINAIDFSRETTPLPAWMNTMPTYSLWWICCLGEYVFRTGDKQAYFRNREYLINLVKQYEKFVTADGFVKTETIFMDWPSRVTGKINDQTVEEWRKGEAPDEEYGVVAICAMAMDYAQKLFAIDETCVEEASLIRDRLNNIKGAPKTVKAAKALYMLVGFGGNGNELTDGGAKGLSTFLSWATLTASHRFGDKEATAKACRDYYGAMLDMGATTFWEDFDLEWLKNACPIDRLPLEGEESIHGDRGQFCYPGFRHSFCHGWSAGVIDYILSCILGVKRISDSEVAIKPYPVFGDMTGTVVVGKGSVTVTVRSGKVSVSATGGIKYTIED